MRKLVFRLPLSKISVSLSLVMLLMLSAGNFQPSAGKQYLNKVYYSTISNANKYTLAIKDDDTLWGWGEDRFPYGGYSSLFTNENHLTPNLVTNKQKFLSVSAGNYHRLYILDDQSLWFQGCEMVAWSPDSRRALGMTKVADKVISAACGNDFCAYVTVDGGLYMWGINRFGEFGDGTSKSSEAPKKIMEDCIMVSITGDHTVVLKKDGSVWDWVYHYDEKNDSHSRVPTKVMGGAIYVSAGSYHGAAIKEDNSLWTWGDNDYGQIGNGKHTIKNANGDVTDDQTVSIPVKVMDDVAVVQADWANTAAIKKDGTMWLWGAPFGDVNSDKLKPVTKPQKYLTDVVDVALGAYNIYCVKKDGSLWYWGISYHRFAYGPFETEDNITKPTPVAFKVKLPEVITIPGKTPFSDVPLGYPHEDAIKWANDEKIVTGFNNKFEPETNLTEAHIAVMLTRYGNLDYDENYAGTHYADKFYQALEPYHLPLGGYTVPSCKNTQLNRGQVAQIIAAVYGLNYEIDDAIMFMYANNFSAGMSSTQRTVETYGKDLPITRAAAVAFLQKMSAVTKVVDIQGNIHYVDQRGLIGLKK